MQNSTFVSVIVPIFNAESYLTQCLESLQKQRNDPEVEFILIDDGSNDNSLTICNTFAAHDSRFHVVHQNNSGVSSARANGMGVAKGAYIVHVDADDWVESDMLENFVTTALETNADVILYDYFYDDSEGSRIVSQNPGKFSHDTIFNQLICGKLHGSCCNKLVKRSVIEKFGVAFPKGINRCEDLIFNLQLFSHAVTASYVPRAFYHYRQINPKSMIVATAEQWDTTKLNIRNFCLKHLEEPYRSMVAFEMEKQICISMILRKKILNKTDFKETFTHLLNQISCSGYNVLERAALYMSCKGYFILANWFARLNIKMKKVF